MLMLRGVGRIRGRFFSILAFWLFWGAFGLGAIVGFYRGKGLRGWFNGSL